ncbi:hypothetical protein niasHS_015506 [Heterodera schachtii]|uniref:Lon proteolytic domain-containing protein n=1 Tax=Heterodera schachtii TaxID=97005 RepID=A0ABD2I501_HETSC
MALEGKLFSIKISCRDELDAHGLTWVASVTPPARGRYTVFFHATQKNEKTRGQLFLIHDQAHRKHFERLFRRLWGGRFCLAGNNYLDHNALCCMCRHKLCRSDTAITAWIDGMQQIRGVDDLALKALVASEEDEKIKRLVMSRENQQEWEALPPNTKGQVQGIFVGNVNELIAQVFKPIPSQ